MKYFVFFVAVVSITVYLAYVTAASGQAAKDYNPQVMYTMSSQESEDLTSYVTWQSTPAATSIFAANQFGFTANAPGYIGLQVYNTGEHKAVFSIWDAADHPQTSLPKDSRCNRFDHEGLGSQCIIDYPWVPNREYQLLVKKGSTTGTSVIWDGYVKDTVSGVSTKIGSFELKNINQFAGFGNLIQTTLFFHEYFALGQQDCTTRPVSKVQWRGPYFMQGTQLAKTAVADHDDCTALNMTSPQKGTTVIEVGAGVSPSLPNGSMLWNDAISPTGPACTCPLGDSNCDGRITLADFESWRRIFRQQ